MSRYREIRRQISNSLPGWLAETATFWTTKSGKLAASSEFMDCYQIKDREVDPEDALVIGSKNVDDSSPEWSFDDEGSYSLFLDLDGKDVTLRPSGTPGNYHLMIRACMTKREHDDVLEALAKAGIIQWGFARSGTGNPSGATLRLPWVRKGEDKTLAEQKGWKTTEELETL